MCVRWKLIAAQRRISWVAVVSTPLLSYYWMYYVLSYLVAIVDCFQYQYNRHDAIRLNERQHIQFLLDKQPYCRVTKNKQKNATKNYIIVVAFGSTGFQTYACSNDTINKRLNYPPHLEWNAFYAVDLMNCGTTLNYVCTHSILNKLFRAFFPFWSAKPIYIDCEYSHIPDN